MQSPSHYKDTRLMDLLIDRQVPWAEGNVMKYVFRWRDKDGIKDLHKARDYLLALIANAELKQMGDTSQWVQGDLFQVRQSEESN